MSLKIDVYFDANERNTYWAEIWPGGWSLELALNTASKAARVCLPIISILKFTVVHVLFGHY
jgi:hypothetical protein